MCHSGCSIPVVRVHGVDVDRVRFPAARKRAIKRHTRACSSVGRALHSHCRGQGFEFPQVHTRLKNGAGRFSLEVSAWAYTTNRYAAENST